MQDYNYLVENITSFIEGCLDKSKLDSAIGKRKKFLIISLLSWILAIISMCLTLVLANSMVFVTLFLIALDITFVVLGIVYLTKSSYSRVEAFNYVNKIEWKDIYNKSFDLVVESTSNSLIKKTKFIDLERKIIRAPIKDYNGSPKSWLSRYSFFKGNDKRNCLVFSFDDKLVNYQVNQIIRTVEKIVVPTKNGTQTTYIYHYIATTGLTVQNTKFDESYNGIVIFSGKPNKDSYQTESIEFNKRFGINVSNTDLRGPKLLRPKYIDSLTMKNSKSLSGIAIFNDFIIGHQYVNSTNVRNEVAIFHRIKSFSKEKILESFANKVKQDIESAMFALSFIEGIY
ncbi:hypothetical protein [Spiroplasma endosymbiont of Cantharis lateralis]|uniref:hypothetical protein n=1 Tax=Spiroplasma endosymbiont of Cantharis lateralis TaxID=3066277 RepID=UPI00313DB714